MHGIKDVTGMIHTLLKCRQAAVIGLLSAALLASVGQVQPAAQTGPAGPDRSPGPKSDPMAQARRSYNEQKYEEAIAAATEARRVATSAAPASVVLARAHLERYRVTSNGADLIGARDALKAVDAAALSPRDQVELSIALGESLYLDEENTFDDRYSAAAEQFEVALGQADLLDVASRDLLFDWWALALDRQAQLGTEAGRKSTYRRIAQRAERELAENLAATSAAYWLAAASNGMDELPRAWGAAVAGWVRAGTLGARGAALREDLDRLVVQMILPERAKQIVVGGDARPVLASLQEQWQQLKERWR